MRLVVGEFLKKFWRKIMLPSLVGSTSSSGVAVANRTKPFVVICGCTGTGKTKLSIELAEWLISRGKRAEIINADAMQVKYLLKNQNDFILNV